MLFNQSDLDKEIDDLQLKIVEKRKEFDEGLKNNIPFQN